MDEVGEDKRRAEAEDAKRSDLESLPEKEND